MSKPSSKTLTLIVCLGVPLVSGAAVGLLISPAIGAYKKMIRPPLSPPPAAFPIAWTILYALMGLALYYAVTSGAGTKRVSDAKQLFAAQLLVNLLWPIVFFRINACWAAALCLAFLIVLVFMTGVSFGKASKTAARLLVPYIVWLFYAMYLNVGVCVLN